MGRGPGLTRSQGRVSRGTTHVESQSAPDSTSSKSTIFPISGHWNCHHSSGNSNGTPAREVTFRSAASPFNPNNRVAFICCHRDCLPLSASFSSAAAIVTWLFFSGMSSFWANACNYAYILKPLQTKLENSYISCGVVVRCTATLYTPRHTCFCLSSRSDAMSVRSPRTAFVQQPVVPCFFGGGAWPAKAGCTCGGSSDGSVL